MKYLKKFNEGLSDFFKSDVFGNGKRIVDLEIIEYNGENIIATLKVSKETADDIAKAINKDRDNGGLYGAYYV